MLVLIPSVATHPRAPSVIIVAGAFLHVYNYTDLAELICNAGYKAMVPELASSWSFKPRGEPVSADATGLRTAIEREVNAGHEVVLVMHSYGAIVGSAAAKGLSKAKMEASGRSGGVIGLIFIGGYIVSEGVSVRDTLSGGEIPPDASEKDATTNSAPSVVNPYNLNHMDFLRQMYNMSPLPEDSIRATFRRMLTDQKECLTSPSPEPAWPDDDFQSRRAYIRTLQDGCLPAADQSAMIEASGVGWDVKDIDAGYNACKTHPLATSDAVLELIKQFSSEA